MTSQKKTTPSNADPAQDRQLAALRSFDPYIVHMARHYAQFGVVGLEPDDLEAVARVGLLRGLERVRSQDEAKANSYLRRCIRGAMLDEVRRQSPVDRGAGALRRAYRDAVDWLESDLGRQPTAAETAEALGIPVESLAGFIASMTPRRRLGTGCLEWGRRGGAAEHLVHPDYHLGEPVSPSEALDRASLGEVVAEVMARLTADQSAVIRRIYLDGHSATDVAGELGLTRGRVSQLKKEALRRLRVSLSGPVGAEVS